MSQYLDSAGLQTLVTETKKFARKSAKEAVNASAAAASKTITGWDDSNSAAEYGNIEIVESQVTGLENDLAAKAPLDSPAFSGTPTAPKADGTNESAVANVEYVKDLVGTLSEAMLYKGAVSQATDLPTDDYKAGWTYKVAVAGTYAGKVCEVGDLIIANKNYASGTASSADWDVIQTNIDGAVTGPQSSTNGNFVLFDGDTGKVIKNSNVNPDSFKTKQNSYSSSSGTLATLTAIEQNTNGEISVTFQDIQSATTSQKGVVELAGSIGTTVDSENNKAATEKAVRDAINALDVSEVTVGASNTLASISEVDGKIQTQAVAIQIAKSQVNGLETDLTNIATSAANLNGKIDTVSGNLETSAAALDAKITAVSGAVDNIIEDLDANIDSTGGVNVSANIVETNGKITSLTLVDHSVNSTDIQNAINALAAPVSAIAPSATITSISETDGKIAITSGAIAITTGQITDFNTVLAGYKTKQTAVNDPSAEGNDVEFIDSISQDANGVITATKKTVPNADGSTNGLMSSADYTKLAGIAAGATSAYVDQSTGVLYINGSSAMGPISTDAITALFS